MSRPGVIHVVLKTKEVVSFVEDIETRDEFNGLITAFGDDVTNGVPIQGRDEHDDEVYLPASSISYIRGVFR